MKATPVRIRRSKDLLVVSAVTYLVLALALGVHVAFVLVIASAIIALWVAAARRFPVIGALTAAFFRGFVPGLISGLFGSRGGGYTYRSGYRRRR